MSEIVLFHHALGLTDGVRALAGSLTSAGHVVHLPDLFEGRTFSSVPDGVGFAVATGFDVIIDRGHQAAAALPNATVFAGISLGVLSAQSLAQSRPDARAALLLEACVPTSEFGGPWPGAVPVQVHGMEQDPSFAGEGDLDAARALVAEARSGELFLYPGEAHLFTDDTLPGYDAGATELVLSRILGLLDTLDAR